MVGFEIFTFSMYRIELITKIFQSLTISGCPIIGLFTLLIWRIGAGVGGTIFLRTCSFFSTSSLLSLTSQIIHLKQLIYQAIELLSIFNLGILFVLKLLLQN